MHFNVLSKTLINLKYNLNFPLLLNKDNKFIFGPHFIQKTILEGVKFETYAFLP